MLRAFSLFQKLLLTHTIHIAHLQCVINVFCLSDNDIDEPKREKTYLRTCASSDDSDQPAQSRSLIIVVTGHILDSQVSKVSSCGQQRL